MSELGDAFREEVEAKVGHAHTLAMPEREPTFSDFTELFADTTAGRTEAAAAAGYGTAAEARAAGPAAVRDRRTFMRGLQRRSEARPRGGAQRRGAPGTVTPAMRELVRAEWRAESVPRDPRAVLRLLHRWGATVSALELTFAYEDRKRSFGRFSVGVKPDVLRRSGFTSAAIEELDWDALAEAFLLAWGRAYGMGDYAAGGGHDVEALSFRVGFTERSQYQWGRTSRPAGAANVNPRAPKYRGMAS